MKTKDLQQNMQVIIPNIKGIFTVEIITKLSNKNYAVKFFEDKDFIILDAETEINVI